MEGRKEEKGKGGNREGRRKEREREDSSETERIQISLKILFPNCLSPAARLIFV